VTAFLLFVATMLPGGTAGRDSQPARGRRHLPRAGEPARPCPRQALAEIEIETAPTSPFFDELVAAGAGLLAGPEQRRLERAAETAKIAIELYGAWLEGTLADGIDDWAIGRERHDAMVGLRGFDGLDADAILELG
jgi:hypothetical protein